MSRPVVKFKRLREEAFLPEYKTAGAAGMDVYSPCDVWHTDSSPVDIPLGFAVEVPPGYELQLRPRSSLSLLGVFSCLGTIDSDYRGEVKAVLWSHSGLRIGTGQRIAQLVLAKAPQAEIVEVDELSPTERGAGGFGSTGR